jgi:hypothetical protein
MSGGLFAIPALRPLTTDTVEEVVAIAAEGSLAGRGDAARQHQGRPELDPGPAAGLRGVLALPSQPARRRAPS